MCAAGLVVIAIGLLATKNDITEARGIDKIAILTSICFAITAIVTCPSSIENHSSPGN